MSLSLSHLKSGHLPTKSELFDFFNSLTPQQLEELDQLLLTTQGVWLPQPGPQTLAVYTEAQELFFGGAAGGGKTDLLLGLAATEHSQSIIWRREYPQLDAIVERSKELYNGLGKFRDDRYFWRLEGWRRVEFRAMQLVKDAMKFQGRPHDLKGYDEITHFTKFQYTFTKAWNRSVKPGQRCRTIAVGNPPVDVEGRWVIEYWGPWLDEKNPRPAKAGELRWFISVNSKDYEVEGKGNWKFRGNVYESKSRTFIPSRLDDNLFLSDTDYSATLDTLPEPLRSQLRNGDFTAGIEDDEHQLFPTAWIKAAQARWKERTKPRTPVDQVGVDVARGGRDKTVITPRWGNYFGEQKSYPGTDTASGQTIAQLVLKIVPPPAYIAVDVIGVGSSPVDWLTALKYNVASLNGAEGSQERDRSGMLGFVNQRAEWCWKFREALDPETGDSLAIPDDPELLADLAAFQWKLTVRGIQVIEKDKIKEVLNRSPDKGESLLYSFAKHSKAGMALFDLFKEQSEQKKPESPYPESKRW